MKPSARRLWASAAMVDEVRPPRKLPIAQRAIRQLKVAAERHGLSAAVVDEGLDCSANSTPCHLELEVAEKRLPSMAAAVVGEGPLLRKLPCASDGAASPRRPRGLINPAFGGRK